MACFIGIAAFLAFANTLGHALVYDDKLILASPLVQDPWNLRALFSNGYYDSPKGNLEIYRPLTNVTFVLNYELNRWIAGDGANAFGFHLVTVVCHVLASALAFVWLERLGAARAVAFSAALLFAVHPLHSEAVANVSGRSEPLALAFGMAFLIAHRSGRILVAALFYFAALWSKESAVAFLPVAVLADALVSAGRPPRRFLAYGACALVLVVWLALRAQALIDPPSAIAFIDNPLVRVSTLERVLTAAKVQLLYVRLSVFPIGLSTDYSFDHVALARGLFDPCVLGFAAVAAAAIFGAVKLRRAEPLVALSVGAYAACFAATSNFLFPIGTLMAERLAYTPSLWVCLAASAGAWRLGPVIGRRAIAFAVGLIAILGLVLTLAQNRVWRDEPTLYREQVRSAPDSAKSHINLAQSLSAAGDLPAAAAEYEAALRIAPDYAWTWYLLGDVHERMRARDEALADWSRALALDPGHVEARLRTVAALLDLGRRAPALPHMTELVARDPEHPALADLLVRLQLSSSAEDQRVARAELDRARALAAGGDRLAAVAAYQRAFRTFALAAQDRSACLSELCDGLRALGKPKLETAWRRVARALE